MRFQLPNSFRDPFRFEEIISLFEEILQEGGELDMRNVTFIEPWSMVCLVLMGKAYLKNRGEKITLTNLSLPVHQYLARMDFFQTGYFQVDRELGKKMMLKRSSFSNRVLEVVSIPGKERESIETITKIIALFRSRASHILKHWLRGEVVNYFVTVISELCQNIFEHSLDSGYLAMQTYTFERENVLRLIIADSGIGIRKSFEMNTDRSIESTSGIIQEAITEPISSKRPFGYGLCQVHSIVEELGGELLIRSDDAMVSTIRKNRRSSSRFFLNDKLNHFQGTQVSVSLSSPG